MLLISDRLIYDTVYCDVLTRWKKDEKDFLVKISDDGRHSTICRIPKPILEFLNNPDSIRFVIEGRKILVKVGSK